MKKKTENVKNIAYALKMVWKACKSKIVWHMAINFMQVLLDFVNGIYFLKTIMQIIEGGHSYNEYLFFISTVLFLNTIRAAANAYYYYYLCDILDNRLIYHINQMIFKKAINVELQCYEDKQFYDDYHWAVENVERNISKLINDITYIVSYLFLCVIIIAYVITIDPVILVFAICPIFATVFAKKNYKLNYQKNMEATVSNREKEYVRRVVFQKEYAHELRMTDMYAVIDEKLDDAVRNLVLIYKHYGIKKAGIQILIQLFSSHIAFLGACFYAIYRFIVLKNLSIGDFSVLVTAIVTFNSRISSIVQYVNNAQEDGIFFAKLRSFLEYQPKMKSGNRSIGSFNELELKNVTFSYTPNSAKVLDRISLVIRKGEKIAVVGYNGAGKSTLVKLILRLYDVSSGAVYYNGTDIKDYNIKEYQKRYGVMFQENNVYALSAAENVLMDDYDTSQDQFITDLLEKNGNREIINSKKGILTNLTKEFNENGMVLSGGQKQKLFLARLHAGNFDIAILDEPSSALDPISEHEIYEKIIEATKDKTVIYVSHRLSSATLADRIVFLNNNRIEETGTHDQLMNMNRIYAAMFKTQADTFLNGEC